MLVTLKLQIRFYDLDNNLIILNPGQQVFVDLNQNIASYNGVCFDIGREEYTLPS